MSTAAAYVLIGLLFGQPGEKPAIAADVYPNAETCEIAKVAIMSKALALTNSTTLIPAAKCVPMVRPDPA